NTIKSLKIDNNTVSINKDSCDFQLTATHFIEWCVTGLSSHILTLKISTTTFQSQDNCVNATYKLNSSENTSINLSISYQEQEGCKRTELKTCFLD
ncbi:hypothetical protein BgiBS90_018839, partial [Biomphalaria glabrata]